MLLELGMELRIRNGTRDLEAWFRDIEVNTCWKTKSCCSFRRWLPRERVLARLRGVRLEGKFSHSCVALSDWSPARPARRWGAGRANREEASARRFSSRSHDFTSGKNNGKKFRRLEGSNKSETLHVLGPCTWHREVEKIKRNSMWNILMDAT